MSFYLILFQRKILQLISQYLVTLKEYFLLYRAGCHHHLHFCLICMGLHNLNKINWFFWRKRRIKFCFRYQKYINIFVNYMLQRLKLVLQRIYVKMCKDQSIDVFTTYIFQSFMGFRENSSIKIWWNFMWFFKKLIPPYRFITRVTKRIWLTYLMTMPRYWGTFSWNSFCFLRQYYHYYQHYINSTAMKIRRHF